MNIDAINGSLLHVVTRSRDAAPPRGRETINFINYMRALINLYG